MSQNTKDWIKLIAQIFGTGSAVIATSVLGGMKPWLAVLVGLGVAGSNVYHSFSSPPGKSGNTDQWTNQNPDPKP